MTTKNKSIVPKFCHIYSSTQWHDDAYIVGDVEALTQIKQAIERALNSNISQCELCPNDGEGYRLHVIKLEDPNKQQKMLLPYTEDYAQDTDNNKVHPSLIVLVS